MTRPGLLRLVVIALGMVCVLPAWARTPRLYDIELVLFSQLEPGPATPDDWPLPVDPLDRVREFGDGFETDLAEPGLTDGEILPAEEPPPFARRLADGELEMGPVFYSLRVSGRYRPFLHQGWRQPGVPAELTQAREIVALDGQSSVSGTATLTAGTYLHMELDLKLTLPDGTRYTLAERRQVKTAETNYFDHPLFGAIIVVRRSPAMATFVPAPAVEPADLPAPADTDPAEATP